MDDMYMYIFSFLNIVCFRFIFSLVIGKKPTAPPPLSSPPRLGRWDPSAIIHVSFSYRAFTYVYVVGGVDQLSSSR